MKAPRILVASMLLAMSIAPLSAQTETPASPNVSLQVPGGKDIPGYLVVPEGKPPFPAVLLIHEWWGLSRNIAGLADRLGAEGYLVLAVDLYRGSFARSAQEAAELATAKRFEEYGMVADAALSWLALRPEADRARLGCVGFCFGGRQALFEAARNQEVKATVALYGSGLLTTPEALGVLDGSHHLLGVYGELDPSISAAQRAAFAKLLADRGVPYTEAVYPGVGHAFVKDDRVDLPGPAADAWKKVLAFLDQNLKQTGF
jgi:carboxymethylenebutenolidase